MRDLLFADDSTLVAHDSDGIQTPVDRFADAARMFSLKINIKKTDCLYQHPKFLSEVSLPRNVNTNGKPLEQCKTFKYLGSTVTDSAKLDNEISLRIENASAVYGNSLERLWNNPHVSIRQAVKDLCIGQCCKPRNQTYLQPGTAGRHLFWKSKGSLDPCCQLFKNKQNQWNKQELMV